MKKFFIFTFILLAILSGFFSQTESTKFNHYFDLNSNQSNISKNNQPIRDIPAKIDLLEVVEPLESVEPLNTLAENEMLIDDSLDDLEEHELAPIVSDKSKRIIDDIIIKVGSELDAKIYGEYGSESYNIALLFYQSLKAYRSFLTKPDTGPVFYILYNQNFSGRYHYNNGVIALGSYVIREGESRFLVTLFHEYQHHLFHTIYGTPEYTDIVGKFYNELSAYIFEFLLASYMPYEAYKPHRGRIPVLTKKYLNEGRVRDLYELIMKMMLPNDPNEKPLYGFLKPIVDGVITIDDVLDGISKDFHPDPIIAEDLQYEIEEEKNANY